MLRVLYRAILRLYPAEVRRAHSAEMESIFLHCLRVEQARRPRVIWPLIWMRGLADALGFALAARRPVRRAGRRGTLAHDARWVVRGIRARGWSAVLAVALMAVAMGASTLVFSSADALLFNRVPYPQPERLVTLSQWIDRQRFDDLQPQTDIFTGVAAHLQAVTFLTGPTEPTLVNTAYVTTGLFETLGVVPQWGRSLTDADRLSTDPTAAVIDASLASERFGTPAAAVGQTLESTDRTFTVAGVMPPGFRYPDGRVRIWRALDVERLAPTSPLMQIVARLAPAVSMAEAGTLLAARVPTLVPDGGERLEIVPRFGEIRGYRPATLHILLGAALCLLLAACASVASLELANGLRRARAYSVQMALGASRASLVRIGMLEAACLVTLAGAAAWGMATAGAPLLTSFLPETITLGGLRPIEVDSRALLFLLAVGAGVWLFAALPAVVYASRPNVLHVLKSDGHSITVSRAGSWVRRGVVTAEVALAVVLLAGGLLYLRSYGAMLAVDTGIETHGVVNLGFTMPLETFPRAADQAQLANRLIDEVNALPYVQSAARIIGGAPPGNAETMRSVPEVDAGDVPQEAVAVRVYTVAPAFFPTVGLTPLSGRLLEEGDPPSNVVITETFARHLWGNREPVGREFRLGQRAPWSTVVGVVPHVRTELDGLAGPSQRAFVFFRPPPPSPTGPAPAATPVAAPRAVANVPPGPLYAFSSILVRLSDPSRATDLLAMARSIDPRARYSVQSLDAAYASYHAEARAATTIISAFAGVAFLIAVAGVFGVMTVLVSSRTREIGIRMAIGADPARVRRMVLGASLRLVTAGVVIGTIAALGLSRFIESQLFGVRPHDPSTLAFVAGLLLAAALLATWHPARRAARVDPVVTLHAE